MTTHAQDGAGHPPPYPIVTKQVPTFYFIGITTAKSSIMKVFPLWVRELGRPEIVIEGVDLKIHDEPEAYRRAVAQIKYDPLSLGGAGDYPQDRSAQRRPRYV